MAATELDAWLAEIELCTDLDVLKKIEVATWEVVPDDQEYGKWVRPKKGLEPLVYAIRNRRLKLLHPEIGMMVFNPTAVKKMEITTDAAQAERDERLIAKWNKAFFGR